MKLIKTLKENNRGFTLLEVLLVVSILAILAGIVLLAINPKRQLAQTRNTQRSVDVSTILDATYQYMLDNNGDVPSDVTTTDTEICATGAASCTGLVDMSVLTNNETFLTSLPQDPRCSSVCAANGTGYNIVKTANDRVTVSAPYAELSATISVTR